MGNPKIITRTKIHSEQNKKTNKNILELSLSISNNALTRIIFKIYLLEL